MTKTKAASLSSSLLARKGDAAPTPPGLVADALGPPPVAAPEKASAEGEDGAPTNGRSMAQVFAGVSASTEAGVDRFESGKGAAAEAPDAAVPESRPLPGPESDQEPAPAPLETAVPQDSGRPSENESGLDIPAKAPQPTESDRTETTPRRRRPWWPILLVGGVTAAAALVWFASDRNAGNTGDQDRVAARVAPAPTKPEPAAPSVRPRPEPAAVVSKAPQNPDPPAVVERPEAPRPASAPTPAAPSPSAPAAQADAEPASPRPPNDAPAKPTTPAETASVAPVKPANDGPAKAALEVAALAPAGGAPEKALAPPPPEPPAPAAAAKKTASAPVRPSAPARGTYAIQLASLRSAADAEREWVRLQRAFPNVLGGRSLALQRAKLTKGVYYRVRTGGFESKAAARAACARLKARKQDCLPIRL